MPNAMSRLVRTFVLPRALYACQVWGPDTLQLSQCGQSSLQSELLPICKHVLGLCVACLAPGRELCAVEVPPPAPYHRLRTFLSRNSLSILSTSRLENSLSTKRPCGYSVRHILPHLNCQRPC
jgi:hypothetical protein